jgi:hypothetical protein
MLIGLFVCSVRPAFDYLDSGSGPDRISPITIVIGSEADFVIPNRPIIGWIPAFIKSPVILPAKYAYFMGDAAPIPSVGAPYLSYSSAFLNPASCRLRHACTAADGESQYPITTIATFGSARGLSSSRRLSIFFCVSESGVRNPCSPSASFETFSASCLAVFAAASAASASVRAVLADAAALPACSVITASNWSLFALSSLVFERKSLLIDATLAAALASPKTPPNTRRVAAMSNQNLHPGGLSGARMMPCRQSSKSSRYSETMTAISPAIPIPTATAQSQPKCFPPARRSFRGFKRTFQCRDGTFQGGYATL